MKGLFRLSHAPCALLRHVSSADSTCGSPSSGSFSSLIRRERRGREIPSRSAARDLFPRACRSARSIDCCSTSARSWSSGLIGPGGRWRQKRAANVSTNRRRQISRVDPRLAVWTRAVRMVDHASKLMKIARPVVTRKHRERLWCRIRGFARPRAGWRAREGAAQASAGRLAARATAAIESPARSARNKGPAEPARSKVRPPGPAPSFRSDGPTQSSAGSQACLQIAWQRQDLADQEC